MIYRLLRPLLFTLDPERAHGLSLALSRAVGAAAPLRAAARGILGQRIERPVEAFGLRFPNRVGLAAGYDKDALGWRGLACLGFGHIEIGTVTPRPQPGNPRPRVFRLAEDRSLINRLGFPGRGADFVEGRIKDRRNDGLVLGVNIGKQKETSLEDAAEDYAGLLKCFAPIADYLVINISSPNTVGLRRLQGREHLERLVRRVMQERHGLETPVPLLIKLSPDLSDEELDDALQVIVDAKLDGIVATNTSLARDGLRSTRRNEAGGLSGSALTRRSTDVIAAIHRRTAGKVPIVACGGVMSADDALRKIDAGATLVQLYTGLIYEGPGLVRRVAAAL